MPDNIVHIGANKTGSTTLQRCLFSQSDKLVYLGEDCEDYLVCKDVINSLIADDDIHFCYEKGKDLFQKKRESSKGKVFIFSSEDVMSSHVPSLCAKRLHEFVPDAKILLVVRNQLTAIPSWYANHGAYLKMVPRRYWKRYVSFDDWMSYCMEFIKYSPLDSYFYHRIISLYANLFGKENIRLLFYEDFLHNTRDFMTDLCALLKMDVDESMRLIEGKRERKRNTMRRLKYLKYCSYFNGFDPGDYLHWDVLKNAWNGFLENGPPAEGFMTDYWRDRIIEIYREDNMKLSADYKIDLRKYGYPMAGDTQL